MWVPAFVCPASREPSSSIFRCLDPARSERLQPFLEQYRFVRERDGYRPGDADYYRSLPRVGPGDPQRDIWRIRERSFKQLRRVLRPILTGAPAVLDLGAGCGWLSHRLAQLGCRSVAVDLLTDDRDGLGAARHYDAAFACVQADFDALPFAPGQFDVVVFNGSLHYAPDVDATLRRAASMLRDDGRLVVIDSPMFARAADGAAMRQRDRERLRTRHGLASPIQPGEGFLTFARLAASAASMGRESPRFFATHDGWRRRLMRLGAATGMTTVRPARFGVWVAA